MNPLKRPTPNESNPICSCLTSQHSATLFEAKGRESMKNSDPIYYFLWAK
jgi:hypothetical protein